MRSSTSDKYLTTGIAYAWHPHRDTWYAAPHCQINWWIPDLRYPRGQRDGLPPPYSNTAVRNNSKDFNYYKWNKESRGPHIAQFVKEDPRPLPRATEPVNLDPQIRSSCQREVSSFLGAQDAFERAQYVRQTRYSVDFRVVNTDDAAAAGAPQGG